MPTGALHSHYWSGSADAGETPPDPPTSGTLVSYPLWQTSVTVGSGLGALQALYERWRPSQTTTQMRDHGHHR
jgi:hypothetical protein